MTYVNEIPEAGVLVEMYRRISLIKQNDDSIRGAVLSGRLAMPYYSARGQELIPVAVSVNLTDRDYICTTYRGIHDCIAKGLPLKLLWAELAGKRTGTCKGKGGPMHITYPAMGIMVTTGIVGASLPIANGLALASQVIQDPRVAIAYFGDGASNIGAFHESLNLAALWKLPVVFVCQNNRYAEHTQFGNGTSVDKVSTRATSYEMMGVTVDGNDPMAMYHASREAIERARAGHGPTLIEAMTFRFHGHVMGDDDSYMVPGEKTAWIEKDPVPRYRRWLLEQRHATSEALDQIDAENARRIEEAIGFAMESSFPDLIELRRDVYGRELPEEFVQ